MRNAVCPHEGDEAPFITGHLEGGPIRKGDKGDPVAKPVSDLGHEAVAVL